MPKLIDAEKLLECLNAEMKEFDSETSSHYSRGRYDAYEWVAARMESGTFDHTPPVQPDIKPGDTVRHKSYGIGLVLDADDHIATVHFSESLEIPFLHELEVITKE